jgi:D-sedoheptulose 7-phosphate isomerase
MEESLSEHIKVMENLIHHKENAIQISNILSKVLSNGHKLLICGNGGSAADAQHFAGELVGRFMKNRQPLKAIALNTDTSIITCIGNDFGFDQVFSRQVEALGQEGDALIAITTSGNSQNVELALQAAKKIGMMTIGLLGNDGGKARNICDMPIVVDSNNTARIQEAHIFLIHLICEHFDLAFD